MSSTSAPASRMPSITAAAIAGECVRMSRPTTRRFAESNRANALPIFFASAGSSSLGTFPRMSYALKMPMVFSARLRANLRADELAHALHRLDDVRLAVRVAEAQVALAERAEA